MLYLLQAQYGLRPSYMDVSSTKMSVA